MSNRGGRELNPARHQHKMAVLQLEIFVRWEAVETRRPSWSVCGGHLKVQSVRYLYIVCLKL